MKRYALAATVAMLAAAPMARAADVTVTLNDQEQQALAQIMDAAVKGSGLPMAGAVAYFQNKIIEAAKVKAEPVPAEKKPADGKK